MKYVQVLVEGQTEESIVSNVVRPYLLEKEIWITPIIITTSCPESVPSHKGGYVPYGTLRKEVMRLLDNSSIVALTTMIDYYKFPKDFPKLKEIKQKKLDCFSRVKYLEEEFYKDINSRKLIPYLSLHEIEALLFVSPKHIAEHFFEIKDLENKLWQIKGKFKSPEEINEEETTHPSARLSTLISGYKKLKLSTCPPIIESIVNDKDMGLVSIRQQCPHFNQWIEKLEKLA